MSDSDDVNSEKLEVQSNSDSEEYENVTIADSGQIESQINANLQLSDNDDDNSEKVEVQSNSDSDEYENVQLYVIQFKLTHFRACILSRQNSQTPLVGEWCSVIGRCRRRSSFTIGVDSYRRAYICRRV